MCLLNYELRLSRIFLANVAAEYVIQNAFEKKKQIDNSMHEMYRL